MLVFCVAFKEHICGVERKRKVFDEDAPFDFCSVLNFRAVFCMRSCNYTLFTWWQRNFGVMLELHIEFKLNFRDNAVSCMCRDNQEDSSNVYHYLRITSSKKAAQISNTLRTTSRRCGFYSSQIFFIVVKAIT